MTMRPSYWALLLLGCLSLLPATAPGQQSSDTPLGPAKVDDAGWQEVRKRIDYSTGSRGQSDEESSRSETARGGGERQPGTRSGGSTSAPVAPETILLILRILLFLMAAVVIAFLLRYLIGLRRTPPNPHVEPVKLMEEGGLEEIEANLASADLEAHIQQAVRQQAYTLAVRLYYLWVLQSLSEEGLVQWARDKTNRQYARELNSSPFRRAFEQATLRFEQAWYGNRPVSEQTFFHLRPQFEQLVQDIRSAANPKNQGL
ncbi:DUF4129 domain-containing protein [Phaeodactylibacter luteus]|uniref:DUF4129 domain-containing protein n=2 Tax=Phaeodactylibacter luteus TaxID=1564516 RepID=A0A5C6S239_9BACT|nr:DUF4129 domain-containing protein [Phaeodactylibacter luteus]